MTRRSLRVFPGALVPLVLGAALGIACGPGACRPGGESGTVDPAEADTLTIFLLGSSTAWGEPYAPRADVGLIVKWLHQGQLGGRTIRVDNRAGPGGTSSDALEAARAIASKRHAPGTAVAFLYLGNNEFLRFDARHDLRVHERTLFDRPTVSPVQREAVLETYARNIEQIVDLLQGAGVDVIASTVAVNEKDWEPNRSVLGDARHATEVAQRLEEGDRARTAGRTEDALAAYLAILELEPDFALASKRAGDVLLELGRPVEARAYYQDAIDDDGNPYRETSAQARILREICARRGVPLVDAQALLAAASPQGVIGFELMWDNCHPTLEGYARIADGFAAQLARRFGEPPRRAELDLRALERDLGFDDAFRAEVFAGRGQYCYAASTLTVDPRARLDRARLYLEQAAALAPDAPDVLVSAAVLDALRGDVDGSLAFWHRAFALDPRTTLERARNASVRQVMERRGVEDLAALLESGARAAGPRDAPDDPALRR